MTRHARKRVQQSATRSVERALMEERTAIAAITKVFLMEVDDPTRVLARLDAMVRAAEHNPRTSAVARRTLLDAVRYVKTAIEREVRRPQSLFDPHVEHVKAEKVDALVNATDGPIQLGLVDQESMFGDVEAAHDERVQTITTVHEALVELIRGSGASSDRRLHSLYAMAVMQQPELPHQSDKAIAERRRELTAAGRLVAAGKQDGVAVWDLVERELI